jgi:acyl-CoA reductase-like NAD-dependent aldehyde dehydrogenase
MAQAATTQRKPEFRDYTKLYIDGKWVDASSGKHADVINPATEEVIGRVAMASKGDTEKAIAAARRAFDEGPWPKMHPKDRSKVILQLANALQKHFERLAETTVLEAGATISLCRGVQVQTPINYIFEYGELAGSMSFVEHVGLTGGGWDGSSPRLTTSAVVREPTGVVGAITPWNFPTYLNLVKIGPALAAGCTMVLKPATITPLDAIDIARIIDEETDLPKGVFNVVTGGGVEVGETLCTDPRVDKITFTGSTEVGRRIMELSSNTIKRVTLELGGKSAAIYFADTKAPLGSGLVWLHAGQGCAITTRVLVQEPIYEEWVAAMAEQAKKVTYGDTFDPKIQMGPLSSASHRERVEGYVKSGIEQGATVVTGGKRPNQKGFFYEPTVFANVRNDMKIAQEEIFGPVTAVIPFRDKEDAIRIANDSMYGLSGAVSTADLNVGLEVARRIRTGGITVTTGPGVMGLPGSPSGFAFNGGNYAMKAQNPFGGFKQSGIGRENGIWGIQAFTEIKRISFS